MGSIKSEEPTGRPNLAVSREPVGPVSNGGKGTMGDTAFKDAVLIVGLAWLTLAVLYVTLRRHNI